ncbi:hypothetical protein MTO96_043268, partial [Rhipicephalus appendiculatus]
MSGRKRFTLGDDIALTKEVLELNPFLDPANWLKIADRLSELLGWSFSLRSVKERLNLILVRFLRDEKKKIKSSGTEEQTELQDLLQRVVDLARECGYSPPRSTMRLLADGGKGPKGRPRAPQQRRVVDVHNREQDVLAAFAESTARGGIAPGPQRHAEATYALLEARYDRETALENRRLQLEEDRLRFEMKRHDQELKLKELELQRRHAEQQAKFRLKELELQQRQQELEAL